MKTPKFTWSISAVWNRVPPILLERVQREFRLLGGNPELRHRSDREALVAALIRVQDWAELSGNKHNIAAGAEITPLRRDAELQLQGSGRA